MIVTIDGPAGSGKSAAAQLLARRLGMPHLDTGAMYRAIGLDAMELGILKDPDAIAARAREVELKFDWSQEPATIMMNGRNVSELIRTPEVTAITYVAADNPWVREELVKQQRRIGREAGSLVTEGRDQGSVVFPQANFKFFLDAHPEERARRRIGQLAARGINAEISDVLDKIVQRDMRDQGRAVGPLSRPADAILIDTTELSLEQVVQAMLAIISHRRQEAAGPHRGNS